jgi:AcrR family transcriptional regulator
MLTLPVVDGARQQVGPKSGRINGVTEQTDQTGQPGTTRADATRARLLDAAVAAFAAKGFHGTTTRDIASAAGMSPAALYVHHRSKEELLFQICRDGHQSVLDLVRAAAASADTPTEQLRAMTREFAEDHAREHTRARIVNYELAALSADHYDEVLTLRLGIEREVRSVVEAGAATGEFSVPDPGMTTTAILSLGIDISRWYREAGRWVPDEIAERYAELTLRLVGVT